MSVLRFLAPATLAALIAAGCGSATSPTRTAAVTLPACHARAAYGAPLHGAGLIDLPGAPDGVAATPDGSKVFVAIQSGAPRLAVVSPDGVAPTTIALPAYASGMRVTPSGQTVLAAVGDGVVALDTATGRLTAHLTAPSPPGPGAAEIAVTPDSRYAFVSLEGAGRVAVFDLSTRTYKGSVEVGSGALGLALSPDGRYLYSVSEGVGRLDVISVEKALGDPAEAVLASVKVPCAPVRLAVSPDGRRIWVTARDGNVLLGYDRSRLVHSGPHALISVTSIGTSPLGVAVTPGGKYVLAADMGARGDRSGVSVVDAGTGRLLGTVPTGHLADAIAFAHGLALVSASDSDQLDLIALSSLG